MPRSLCLIHYCGYIRCTCVIISPLLDWAQTDIRYIFVTAAAPQYSRKKRTSDHLEALNKTWSHQKKPRQIRLHWHHYGGSWVCMVFVLCNDTSKWGEVCVFDVEGAIISRHIYTTWWTMWRSSSLPGSICVHTLYCESNKGGDNSMSSQSTRWWRHLIWYGSIEIAITVHQVAWISYYQLHHHAVSTLF